MNPLTSTSSKLSTLALSAAMTLALAGAVVGSFSVPTESATVRLPTVIIIGHRDAPVAPQTLQADAKPVLKSGA